MFYVMKARLKELDGSISQEEAVFSVSKDMLIHSYSRKQAIEDGILINVTETAREAGFRYPVAVTRAVWDEILTPSPSDTTQSVSGRLWICCGCCFWNNRSIKTTHEYCTFVDYLILCIETKTIKMLLYFIFENPLEIISSIIGCSDTCYVISLLSAHFLASAKLAIICWAFIFVNPSNINSRVDIFESSLTPIAANRLHNSGETLSPSITAKRCWRSTLSG